MNPVQPSLFPQSQSSVSQVSASDDLTGLNSSQLKAVQTTEGAVLVIAGAGTGKTRTLVHRLAYLVRKGISPENILLLTFTRKAAQAMINRASALLDQNCRQVWGGTFHSVANALLRRYGHNLGYRANFTILDRGDSEGIINQVRDSLKLANQSKRFPRRRVICNIFSGAINKSLKINDLIDDQFSHLFEFSDDLIRINEAYQSYKKENSLMDYDDLLVNLRDLLQDFPQICHEIGERYRYIMVDEYQDTNHLQAEIVRLIASVHGNVMAVGDDAQSIYSFRGADFRNIMDFPRIFPATEIIRLEENYRSTQSILAATNAINMAAVERYEKNLFSSISGGAKPVLYPARDEFEQARYVAKEIDRLRGRGRPLNEIAVLFRSGYHSYKLEMELANRQIAFEKRGGLKLTESAHIKDLLSYLRVIANPGDNIAWQRILMHLPGIGLKTATRILVAIQETDEPVAALAAYQGKGKWQQDLVRLADFLVDLSRLDNPSAYYDLAWSYYRPFFQDIFADDYPRRERDLEQLRGIVGDYQTLADFLDDTVLDPPEAGAADSGLAADVVVLSTVHSAKGLEWDTVFIIHLADGKFPSIHAQKDSGQLEEERRLLYVAATRARKKLYMIYPRQVTAPDRSREYCAISPFVDEIPPNLFSSSGSVMEKKQELPGLSQSVVKEVSKERDGVQMREGLKVGHSFFGEGRVVKVKDSRTVDVFFPRHGLKTLRLDYASLKIVS